MSSEQEFPRDNQPSNVRYPHSGDLPQDQGGERPIEGAPEGPIDPTAEQMNPPDVVPTDLIEQVKALRSELEAKKQEEATAKQTAIASRSKRNKIIAAATGVVVVGAGIFGIAKANEDNAGKSPKFSEGITVSQLPLVPPTQVIGEDTRTVEISPSEDPSSEPETPGTTQEATPQDYTLTQETADGLKNGEGYTDAMLNQLRQQVNTLAAYPDIFSAMQSSNPRTMLNAFCMAVQDGFKSGNIMLPTNLVAPGMGNVGLAGWIPQFLDSAINSKNNLDPTTRADSITCTVNPAKNIKRAISDSGDPITDKLASSPDQSYLDQFGNAYIGANGIVMSTSNNGAKILTVAEHFDMVYYIETLDFVGDDGNTIRLGFLQNLYVNPSNLPKPNNK